MTAVGTSYRSDARRVARVREPVMDGRPDPAPLDGRLAGSMVTGNQQHHPIPASDCLLERAVDRKPGAVEVHAVEIENSIGLDGAATKFTVPGPVEGSGADRNGFRRCLRLPGSRLRLGSSGDFYGLLNDRRSGRFAG